jgi:D-glycero-alpha-D-manno-heptose-7-phosphate kinase
MDDAMTTLNPRATAEHAPDTEALVKTIGLGAPSGMIITRTPLRISLGGGGTDLPSCYERIGGFVVTAAINKYVFVGIHGNFVPEYWIKYSEVERVTDVKEIKHGVVREALIMHGIEPGVEIISLADIPAGTGLGSSGTFTVGLLRALYAHKREYVPAAALAEEACDIEINRLDRPSGKQDQYIAAHGGIICMEIATDGTVNVSPLAISKQTIHDLEEHMLLFFTGYSRDADKVLATQKTKSSTGDKAMLDNLVQVMEMGRETKRLLEAGDTEGYGRLMHKHWQIKRKRDSNMSNPNIDRWYERGLNAGAIGGKLVGAGGGGFLLFYTKEPWKLREAMSEEGLTEVRFQFDHDGSTVIVRG